MADKKIVIGANFRAHIVAGSLGVVTDTRYVMCYWPALNEPVALFADGSSGMEVQGPPTPRNVLFPPDTVFLPVLVNDARLGEPPRWRETDVPTKGDCFFVRRKVMQQVSEDRQHVCEIEVEPGLVRLVTYSKPDTFEKEVDVVDGLTLAEAAERTGKVKAFAHLVGKR